jgi:hypothetical protein
MNIPGSISEVWHTDQWLCGRLVLRLGVEVDENARGGLRGRGRGIGHRGRGGDGAIKHGLHGVTTI